MNKYNAPALDKGLDILEYLSEKAIPLTQNEIAQGLDKSANEIYRMLVCLDERGYLIKNAASGKYSLSLKLYQLSHRHSPLVGILKAAKPAMEELANKTKQSCHMGILYNDQLMIVSQMRSPGPVSLSIEEGSLFPLIKTTSGRVLLAFMDDKSRSKTLATNPEYNKLSKSEQKNFNEQLQQIKERGYELSKSQITIGVYDIGVPIGSFESGVYSALTISSLTSVSEQNKSGELLIETIQHAANEINASIGNN